MIDLFHCFGARPTHRVTTELAADMLRASRCRYLAVNTHNVHEVSDGDELPVGYASATLGAVRQLAGEELGLIPVLNINHPTSADEAVERTRRAVALTGINVIKLEVLDDEHSVTRNDEVVRAAARLIDDGLEVWPLITADAEISDECQRLGAAMVRVMGSPIGARRGIDEANRSAMREMLSRAKVPVMLDGGIGSTDDAVEAYRLGFDSVLVNSCLFTSGADPVASLQEFRAVADRAATTGNGVPAS